MRTNRIHKNGRAAYVLAAICIALIAGCEKMPANTSAVTAPPPPSGEDSTLSAYTFIPIDAWLPGTVWVSNSIVANPMTDKGLQANREYLLPMRANWTDNIGPACADTIHFENSDIQHLPYPGRQLTYSVRGDSVAVVGEALIYQLSADTLVMYNWPHLCSFTMEVQSAMYVKIGSND